MPDRELTKQLSSRSAFNLLINFTAGLLLHLYTIGKLSCTPLALLLAYSRIPKEWQICCSTSILNEIWMKFIEEPRNFWKH